MTPPFVDGVAPSDAELRIAQAQLVGWLRSFHGIQTTPVAQQMAARAQLENMRKALPQGAMGAQAPGQVQGEPGGGPHMGSGPYL